MDDTSAILKALEPKVSSRETPLNEGVGLTMVSELARLTEGWLLIVSGSGMVRMARGGEFKCSTLPRGAYYMGTLVALVFEQGSAGNFAKLLHEAKTHAGILPNKEFRARFET